MQVGNVETTEPSVDHPSKAVLSIDTLLRQHSFREICLIFLHLFAVLPSRTLSLVGNKLFCHWVVVARLEAGEIGHDATQTA